MGYTKYENKDYFIVSMHGNAKKGELHWEPILTWYRNRFPGKREDGFHFARVMSDIVQKHFTSVGNKVMKTGGGRLNFGSGGIIDVEKIQQTAPYGFLFKIRFIDQKGEPHEKNTGIFEALGNHLAIKRATVHYNLPAAGRCPEDSGSNEILMYELKSLFGSMKSIPGVELQMQEEDFYRQIVEAWREDTGSFFPIGRAREVMISGGLTRDHLGDHITEPEEVKNTVGERKGSQVPIRSGVIYFGYCGCSPDFNFNLIPTEDYSLQTQDLENLAELIHAYLRYAD